jgi:hypothetical protein
VTACQEVTACEPVLRFRGVTGRPRPHSIWFVTPPTAKTLTKRRAVDFCHVATAICSRVTLP